MCLKIQAFNLMWASPTTQVNLYCNLKAIDKIPYPVLIFMRLRVGARNDVRKQSK